MPKDVSSDIADTRELLYHIQSLGGITTREEIGSGAADALVRESLQKPTWIGSYALSEAGERLTQDQSLIKQRTNQSEEKIK